MGGHCRQDGGSKGFIGARGAYYAMLGDNASQPHYVPDVDGELLRRALKAVKAYPDSRPQIHSATSAVPRAWRIWNSRSGLGASDPF